MNRMQYAAVIAFLAAGGLLAGAESLWLPGSQGLLGGRPTLNVGDTVFVDIEASSNLSFRSSSSDSSSATLELAGGEFGGLLSFLPAGRAGADRSASGGQEYALSATLAATVAEVDAAGRARIQGSRTVSLSGKTESVTVAGWVDPTALGAGRRLSFSRLADARLTYRTFLQAPAPVLGAGDIQEVVPPVAQAAQPPAGAGQPAPAAAQPPAGAAQPAPGQPGAAVPQPAAPAGAAATQPAARAYTLTDARKRELILAYLNRLVDFLFQQ